jgi:hypothetical protein
MALRESKDIQGNKNLPKHGGSKTMKDVTRGISSKSSGSIVQGSPPRAPTKLMSESIKDSPEDEMGATQAIGKPQAGMRSRTT